MGSAHAPMWRHFIRKVAEQELSTKAVLDFGCNQGGFLRTLYALRPFQRGLGIDIAADSIKRANELKGNLPLQYEVASDLSRWANQFDLGFSYEVMYLLPDLVFHAEQISTILRPNGVYYAVTGCHVDNPLWPRWRTLIAVKTNTPTRDYSLDDYAEAFFQAGFSVSVQKFMFDDFIPITRGSDYYPKLADELNYFTEAKTLFRFVKGQSN